MMNNLTTANSDLNAPSLQDILRALRQQSLDLASLKKRTGLPLPALRAYITRLLFLGAIASSGSRYSLTTKGQVAVSGSLIEEACAAISDVYPT